MIRRLIGAIKSTSLKSVLTIVLAGILVVVTTACNAKPPAPNITGSGEYHSSKGQQKELYAPVQNKKSGGMYPYEDMDPEPSNYTKRKANELVENAKRNVSKVNGPEEFAENYRQGTPLNERVQNISEDVGQSAKQFTEDVASGAKRNVQKLKENTQNTIEHPETFVDHLQR
ncbi:MAG: hypothetical protein WAN66_22910 [Limnoraphis robusta]|uniref:Lipoprotein n=1 Tax=Limnoraphis robusta CCNP1315 TaxID=3110306 RepID=A0ABU5U5X1_9CYAN|nr:hypothetical protein [Limnoraphis robusta]MEA5522590.1 hypothetical protein [Limnoraphis robusta CCNP1315]MEA5546501.1 hypothetical protein [Limnoraphis robusta CCNP1324]